MELFKARAQKKKKKKKKKKKREKKSTHDYISGKLRNLLYFLKRNVF